MPVTDANYKLVLRTLRSRYENKRAIVNACLSALINQPCMTCASANEIRSLIDTTKEALQSIETLEIPPDEWDPFVVFSVQSKMDDYTKKEWETHLGGSTNIPKYKDLMDFLETQFRILDRSNIVFNINKHSSNEQPHTIANPKEHVSNFQQKKITNKKSANQNSNSNIKHTNSNSNETEKCLLCPEFHWLLHCDEFLNDTEWTPRQRKDFALQNKICILCLHAHEGIPCKSKYRCRKCQGMHSVKLHTEEDDVVQSTSGMLNSTTVATIQEGGKIFAIAIVKVKDKFGTNHLLRVFIDMGSGGTLMFEKAAQLLCLPRKRQNVPLTGVDDAYLGKSTSSIQIQIESVVDNSFNLTLNTHVVRKIIQLRKINEHNSSNWKHLNEIELADPEY